MISDLDRAAITAAVDTLDVESWRPLDDAERDLVRRALAPCTVPPGECRGTSSAT